MLKAMSATSIRSMRVKEAEEEETRENTMKRVMEQLTEIEGSTGLLDSGASHPMRPAPEIEYNNGQPVRVTLAGEDVRVLMQNPPRDHFGPGGGYHHSADRPTWSCHRTTWLYAALESANFEVDTPGQEAHQGEDKEPLSGSGCLGRLGPDKRVGDEPCSSLERPSLKARLEVIRKEEKRDWTELLREYWKTGAKPTLLKVVLASPLTRDLPYEVQSSLVEGFNLQDGEKYLRALPLMRRKRRSLLASTNWVVNLFSGNGDLPNDPFATLPKDGKVVLDVDKMKSKHWDLHREGGVYQLLLWAAASGRISDIISAPPCQTWPVSSTPLRGPEAYPCRTMTEPYGIKDLTAMQTRRTDMETSNVAKQMILWFLAQISGPRQVGFFLELPADCEHLHRDQGVKASLWSTEMWMVFQSITVMPTASFYMGRFGHQSRGPEDLRQWLQTTLLYSC